MAALSFFAKNNGDVIDKARFIIFVFSRPKHYFFGARFGKNNHPGFIVFFAKKMNQQIR